MIVMTTGVPVYADSEGMPVRFGLVQCGPREDLNLACNLDQRCCQLKDMFWQNSEPSAYDKKYQDEQGFAATLVEKQQPHSRVFNIAVQ